MKGERMCTNEVYISRIVLLVIETVMLIFLLNSGFGKFLRTVRGWIWYSLLFSFLFLFAVSIWDLFFC